MYLSRIILSMSVLAAAGWAQAQTELSGNFAPYTGEVTASTLHVRSGPSTNYYPVVRLGAGARVRVVGQEPGWLAIEPPPGCFSLIAAKFVERDGAGGVVNGDNVRVRAGSDLSPQNYAIQLKLSKGAIVNVLGSMDAEFLKIEPPRGARLWVAAEYIRRVQDGAGGAAVDTPPDTVVAESATPIEESADAAASPPNQTPGSMAALDSPAPADLPSGDDDEPTGAPASLSGAPPLAGVADATTPARLAIPQTTPAAEPPTPAPAKQPAPPAGPAETDNGRGELDTLEKILAEEMAKPILNRDLGPLLPRYRELAEASSDEYIQSYVRVRVQQIEAALEMIEGVRSVGRLRDEVHTVRQTAHAERSNIRYLPVRTDGGFDIEGELRPSALYESPIGPKRYRLVDPNVSPARTIGYVEIPADAQVDMSNFLGRRIGVRARERTLQRGDVDPLSIYVASELAVLAPGSGGSSQVVASVKIPAAASGTGTGESSRASLP